MPDVSAPAKFMTANSQRSTPSPTTSINSRNASPDALRAEAERLRERAERSNDPYAMSAYGRFLKNKLGDVANGARWERRAVEAVAARLSPNVTAMESYFMR